jgi:hypothetical protein
MSFNIHVSLYGAIARFGGGRFVAQVTVELEPGARVSDLVERLGIPTDERGYVFVNAVLCEVPGLSTGAGALLQAGDHVGIFAADRLWPYQYRDGVVMSPSLKALLATQGAMHHGYRGHGQPRTLTDQPEPAATQEVAHDQRHLEN